VKRILRLFFLLFLFSGLSKINAQTRTPSFSVVQATSNNGELLSVGSLDMSYKNFKEKIVYPWCLKISIALDEGHLFENKLPKGEESAIANNLEDSLIVKLEKVDRIQYIGHIYYNGFLDIYIYLKDPKAVNNYLSKNIKSRKFVREFEYVIERDPNWSKVSKYIN